jgi:hypothetical protein
MKGEGSTYFHQTHDELGGRFRGAFGPTVVVGQSATHAVAGGQRDPTPDEQPLGYRIDDLEPSAGFSSAEDSAPVSAAPSSDALPDDVEPSTGARLSRQPLRRF